MNKKYTIYTDGSSNNHIPAEQRDGGWAFLVLNKNDEFLYRSSGYAESATSQRMEMTAVIEALGWFVKNIYDQYRSELFTVTIMTDSMYIVQCFKDRWYKRWIDIDYVGVKNVDLWKELLNFNTQFSRMSVRYIHVRGHSGHQWNEEVDRLSGETRISKKGIVKQNCFGYE